MSVTLKKLKQDIERINARLRKKSKTPTKDEGRDLKNAKRRVEIAQLHLQFVENQDQYSCLKEVAKLTKAIAGLDDQRATLVKRLETWNGIAADQPGSVEIARGKLAATTQYLERLVQPTEAQRTSANVDKLAALVGLLSAAGVSAAGVGGSDNAP